MFSETLCKANIDWLCMATASTNAVVDWFK